MELSGKFEDFYLRNVFLPNIGRGPAGNLGSYEATVFILGAKVLIVNLSVNLFSIIFQLI